MGKIFVNYRRDDDPSAAARVRDGLAQRFGKSALFMDVDNLLAGQKFDDELAKALGVCDVLVAVIGTKWMDVLQAKTAAAAADPDFRDYVCEEIAAALKRGIVVIPVRVGRDGALPALPRPSELPEDIRALVSHQKHDVTHERFGRDVADLADAIVQVRRKRAGGGVSSSPVWIGATTAALLAVGYIGAGLSGVAVPGWPVIQGSTRAPEIPPVAGDNTPAAEADAARIKADDAAFATAERRGALDGYGAYLGQFPNGRHVKLANERIAHIKKLDTDFARLSASGTRAELQAFGETNKAFKPRIAEVLAARDAATEAENKRLAAAKADSERKAAEEAARHVPKPGETFRDCPTCPEMVVVPAGSFTMGLPYNEEGRSANEGPVRTVTIRQPFAVGKYEVTVGQFKAFVATGHKTEGGCFTWSGTEWKEQADKSWRDPGFVQTDAHPVTCVSWNDARAYVTWLSKTTGQPYRLLSEAEWEYTARAVSSASAPHPKYHFGDKAADLCTYANGADETAKVQFENWKIAPSCPDGHIFTAPVGTFKPNAFGLHDMHGNVWEWVEDCWIDSYTGAPSDASARTTACTESGSRVLRGGSWSSSPVNLRSAYRTRGHLDFRIVYIGFRVARSVVR